LIGRRCGGREVVVLVVNRIVVDPSTEVIGIGIIHDERWEERTEVWVDGCLNIIERERVRERDKGGDQNFIRERLNKITKLKEI
jgi:hypothetical protein